MSSTVLFLLLMTILEETNGQSQKWCEKLKNTETPCCAKPKPLRCAYLSPHAANSDKECNCYVPEADGGRINLCGSLGDDPQKLINGSFIPCAAYYEKDCAPTNLLPLSKCFMEYPPQPEVLYTFEEARCEFKEKINGKWEFLSTEKFYDFFYTCWLYRCANRLEIPKETRAEKDKLQWCFPPVFPENRNGPKYCPLYTTGPKIYEAIPFNPTQTIALDPTVTPPASERSEYNQSGCVLPPICDEDGTIDKEKYMVPWYSGKADGKHCEVLCPMIGPNNGKSSQDAELVDPTANRCRKRPSCGDEKKYNRFQVPDYETNCRPWCAPNASLEKLSNFGECNAIPVCKLVNEVYGKTDEPFSDNNPYGWEGECITPDDCDYQNGEHEKTHYCLRIEPASEGFVANESNKPDGVFAFYCVMGATVFIFVGAGLFAYFCLGEDEEVENDHRGPWTTINTVAAPATPLTTVTPLTPATTVTPLTIVTPITPMTPITPKTPVTPKTPGTPATSATSATPATPVTSKTPNNEKKAEKDSKLEKHDKDKGDEDKKKDKENGKVEGNKREKNDGKKKAMKEEKDKKEEKKEENEKQTKKKGENRKSQEKEKEQKKKPAVNAESAEKLLPSPGPPILKDSGAYEEMGPGLSTPPPPSIKQLENGKQDAV